MDSASIRNAYQEGRYDAALSLLETALGHTRFRPLARYRLNRFLSLTCFQSNRYAQAGALPLRDPLTKLMRSFPSLPYQVDWPAADQIALPFLQELPWQLPQVAVEVDGTKVVATIDTGGDLFSIPWDLAATLRIEPVATAGGRFAGGQGATVGWARLGRLGLGGIALREVPISLNSFSHPVVGTGLLRQFNATLDYPGSRLVLTRPGGASLPGERFPFLLVHTHLLIACGALNGVGPMHFLVDSGLEADNGAAFAAPDHTLRRAGIPLPASQTTEGFSGVGRTRLDIGFFDIDTLSLGGTTRHRLTGMTGVFPKQLAAKTVAGFPLDGLVSHNFLRHYRWTLDFTAMEMSLEGASQGS
ncbi:MAG: retropepsin-like aspartic protease [Acidimicrobiia bacterium]|nr:retropepsin-like aspartic protease [Acidimicrobiia bacterium]